MIFTYWKLMLIVIGLTGIIAIISMLLLAKISQHGHAPGLADGKLAPCTTFPNCVCSEHPKDSRHFVEPIPLSRNLMLEPMSLVQSTIETLGGNVAVRTPHYISASFQSRIFGFIDDVEIRYDREQDQLHIRSASRVGYSDGGINLKRVKLIREKLESLATQNEQTTSGNHLNLS